jgi:hypothetical protein
VEVTVGSVNNPDEQTFPAVADHVTAGFWVLLTIAVSCCVFPETTLTLEGDTERLTGSDRASV